jgi:transglutaminase-like putative cysteine protease
LKESRQREVVFTIAGDVPVNRWQVAVLAAYDGTVWAVADSQRNAPAQFRPVDSTFPDEGRGPLQTSELTHTVEIRDLGGVWLPAGGWPVALEAIPTDDERAGLEVRFNPDTGTLAAPAGLPPGTTYRLTTSPPPDLSRANLIDAGVSPLVNNRGLSLVSPPVAALAADLTEGVTPGWEQVMAIESQLRAQGFYDRSGDARPGHSVFRLSEFLAEPDHLVAYEEQYAAAAGLLARLNGLSSRVVVGYLLPDNRWLNGAAEVRAGDISAWLEVEVPRVGWIPVDVTPDRTREPSEQEAGVSTVDVAVPNPPPDLPPPEVPPAFDQQQEPSEDVDDGEDQGPDPRNWVSPMVLAVGVGAGAPTSVLLAGALAVLALKARRRARRRRAPDPAARVAGAWYELVDRWQETGLDRPRTATARELAAGWLLSLPPEARNPHTLDEIVSRVDRAVYHP